MQSRLLLSAADGGIDATNAIGGDRHDSLGKNARAKKARQCGDFFLSTDRLSPCFEMTSVMT